MSSKFVEKVKSSEWLLADGATGTNLFDMGLMSGDAPELWKEKFPEKIVKLHRDAIDAGSDLFLTNSFGGNALRLKLHDLGNRAFEISKISAEIARNVADSYNKSIFVAGSVGPTGEIMHPIGELSHEIAVEVFHEQAQGLKEGGVDLIWVETISAPEEFRAAAEAFSYIDLPWVGTMSFDTAGRTMMGTSPTAMVDLISSIPNKPIAFGANCGTGASDLLRTIQEFEKSSSDSTLVAKGNAGIPKYVNGNIEYDGTPELMAKYAIMARNSGAKIIGGCCGTKPEHLLAMRASLESENLGTSPSLEQVELEIGPFSSPFRSEIKRGTSKRMRRKI
ncbi:MAG: betaine--homocysteine S-methyltransferase [Paracoccaceae bacterium]|nr:betaine--homocysteine S-methyltransferase [Paracoccaceae bacterium]